MKKLIAGLGAAVLALGVAGPASAFVMFDTIDDSSSAMSTLTSTITALVSNINTFGATNLVGSVSSSGGNSIDTGDSQEKVGVKTGASSAAILVDSEANSSSDTFDYEAGGPDDTAIKVTDESTVTIENTETLKKDIVSVNVTEVLNEGVADSESGANVLTAGDSVTEAEVESGPSLAGSVLLQLFNEISEIVKRDVVFKPK